MVRLTRNTDPDGVCKYALVRLDRMHPIHRARFVSLLRKSSSTMYVVGMDTPLRVELGEKGSAEEFFVLKLKDRHSVAALLAYASSVEIVDPGFAAEVRELANRAASHPDSGNPT
jgi:hypothetical protein